MNSQKESLSVLAKSNAMLAEVNRKYSTLIENLQGIVFRCRYDKNYTMEFISEACLPVTGHSPQAFLEGNVHFVEIIEPDDREMVRSEIQKAIADKRPFDLAYRICDTRGNIKYLRETGRPVFDRDGDFVALEGFITDVTKEKKMVLELAKEKELLEKYIATSASIFVVIGRDRNVELINQRGCDILGWSHHEIVNKNWFETFIPKSEKRKIVAVFNRMLSIYRVRAWACIS